MNTIIRKMSSDTGLSPDFIYKIVATAPVRYKFYKIAKRNGGERTIAQPAREVKILQRSLIKILLNSLPVHECATGYRVGSSILDNASAHRHAGPILKMDLKDFFPSIRRADWNAYCRETGCLIEEDDIDLTSLLLFHRAPGKRGLRLAIGAPSSPILSNILMYNFDRLIRQNLELPIITYTRYADDMTFSAPRAGYLLGVKRAVARTIRQIQYPRLDLNGSKTSYVTPKYARRITGLTITDSHKISIGRKRKRHLRVDVHRAVNGQLSSKEMKSLAGMLSFVYSVEPSYLDILSRRYGEDAVKIIMKINNDED